MKSCTVGVLAGWQVYESAIPVSFLAPVLHGTSSAAHDRGCNLLLACGPGPAAALNGGSGFVRALAESQDRSSYESFGFWLYGMSTGNALTVQILDNVQPDPGPSGWELVWSDEFGGTVGTKANGAYWT